MNEAADGSCCDAGLGLVWGCYWIYMSFVCLIKKNICFGFLKGQGCVESKNKTSAKRKSTTSSLDPSIIQVDSFKCRADVPLREAVIKKKKSKCKLFPNWPRNVNFFQNHYCNFFFSTKNTFFQFLKLTLNNLFIPNAHFEI